MNEEKATRQVDQIVEEIERLADQISDQPIEAPFAISMGLVKHLPLIVSFLKSQPYQFIDYKEESFGITLYNRADIMQAFKKFTKAVLMGMCPDCGKPMSAHSQHDDHDVDNHHEPPNRLN